MILTFDQIKEYIKHPVNKQNIKIAKEKHGVYNMHVNGVDVKEYLTPINGYENADQKKLRDELARSNKDIYARILQPTNKVFTAKGGSKKIELPEKQIEEFDSQKYNGYELNRWIKFRMNKYIVDPNGLFFVEWKVNEEGKTKAYPTYKNICDIHDYVFNGLMPEYVIFAPEKRKNDQNEQIEGSFYRVVDDAFDYMIWHKSENNFIIIKEETYKNPYGKVPAIPCSNQWSDVSDIFESPIFVSVDTANEYLNNNSSRSIYKYLHLYPIFWRYLTDCPTCQGDKLVDGKTCPSCKGTGLYLRKDISDMIGLPLPGNDEVKITPDVAGYVQPDLETLSEMRVELRELFRDMEFALWGSNTKEDTSNETATATFLNLQPVVDKMNDYSIWAEWVDQNLTDMICKIQYTTLYKGNTSIYGRRYILEPPDILFDKYVKARESGSPKSLLDFYILQYYQTQFETDPILLERQLKRLNVEPFVHSTDDQVKELNVTELDYYKKIYYDDWIKTLSPEELDNKKEEALDKELTMYAQDKLKDKELITKNTEQDERE